MKANDWIGGIACVLLVLLGIEAALRPAPRVTNRGYIEALKLGLARYDTDGKLYWVVPDREGPVSLVPAEGRP